MDPLTLSRIQFGLTSSFHFLYPPISIGLGLCMVFIEAMYLKTKDPAIERCARFWTKVFALVFALGVATGLVQLFGFGTNWSRYSRFVGDVFGSALAAEGIFAFFLESGFLAILLFGWDRVGKGLHFFSTLMVCLGAHFSAIWILVANSWMQTPTGYTIVGEGIHRHAHITDFWAMVFNPTTIDRISHTVIGCWLTGAFLVISISAYYMLKKRHSDFVRVSMKVGLFVAAVAILLQAISGDSTSRGVAVNQPPKLAAFEGVYKTQKSADMYLFGIVDPETKTVSGLKIPGLLSFLVNREVGSTVTGLDQYPESDWPNVAVVFQTYHIMIAMWVLMFIGISLAVYKWRKKTLHRSRWLLKYLIISVGFPHIANLAGWASAEMGRQPWVVYNVLRTSEGVTPGLTSAQVFASICMFVMIFTALLFMFLYLLNEKIKHGPEDIEDVDVQTAHDPFKN